MSESQDVSAISLLRGKTVVSLSTGNKVGDVLELFIDPITGDISGITVSLVDGGVGGLTRDGIYSLGRDAVMVNEEASIVPSESGGLLGGRPAGDLIGTKIITESGEVLGQISNIFVTLKLPTRIIYEARHSILDKLLGREFFIPAALGHALSDDAERLVVPDSTGDIAVSDMSILLEHSIDVRSFDPATPVGRDQRDRDDDTVPVFVDEEETVVRFRDDDDTVLRIRGDGTTS